MTDSHYREYVSDREFIRDYSEYQQRYAHQIRESDRVLIELLRPVAEARPGLTVLDVGCSTGNLLRHIRAAYPDARLTGADLTPEVLDACRADEGLAGIDFEVMDLLDLPPLGVDVVVVNAVLYLLSDDEFRRALASAAQALRPGGTLLVFDFFHPFEQELELRETSRTHPAGLMLHFRSYGLARRALEEASFEAIRFQPFAIPIDLPRSEDDGEIVSYTRKDEQGDRLLFRGTLFQPWCHLIASRS